MELEITYIRTYATNDGYVSSGEVKHDIVSVDKDIDMNKPTEAIWYSIEPFAREQILANLDKNNIISIREVSYGLRY